MTGQHSRRRSFENGALVTIKLCGDEKQRYLRDIEQHIPMKSWKPYWPIAEMLLGRMNVEYAQLNAEYAARTYASFRNTPLVVPGIVHEVERAAWFVHDATDDMHGSSNAFSTSSCRRIYLGFRTINDRRESYAGDGCWMFYG